MSVEKIGRVMSLDVSTKTIGIALFEGDGTLMELTHITPVIKPKPNTKMEELFKTVDAFEKLLTRYIELDIEKVVIEEVNEEMGLELPEGDYETVAGFILSLLGHIPRPNEQLRYKGLMMVMTEMRGLKIEKILLTKERQAAEAKMVQQKAKGETKKRKHEELAD